MPANAVDPLPLGTAGGSRLGQLGLGFLCMAMIANQQFGWSLTADLIAQREWGRAAVGLASVFFALGATWLVPVAGWCVDRYGPRPIVMTGGVLVALAWAIEGFTPPHPALYLGAAFVGGVGAGCVGGACVGNALKWFPDWRGLAVGTTAAGFVAGGLLTSLAYAALIDSSHPKVVIVFGLGQGLLVLVASLFLRAIPQTRRQIAPVAMLGLPVFWVLYATFVMAAAGGLMVMTHVAATAREYGFAFATIGIVLGVGRILNGIGQPLFGALSDRIGRENTMAMALVSAALMLLVLRVAGHVSAVFVLASLVYFLVFGAIDTVFPATSGDTFGVGYAATNAGVLHTAKGVAALLVLPLNLFAAGLGWQGALVIATALNGGAAIIALFVLKPMRARVISDSDGPDVASVF